MLQLKYYAKENEVQISTKGNISVGKDDPKWLKKSYEAAKDAEEAIRLANEYLKCGYIQFKQCMSCGKYFLLLAGDLEKFNCKVPDHCECCKEIRLVDVFIEQITPVEAKESFAHHMLSSIGLIEEYDKLMSIDKIESKSVITIGVKRNGGLLMDLIYTYDSIYNAFINRFGGSTL